MKRKIYIGLCFALFLVASAFAENVNAVANKSYTIDLFSLISFGLAIAALVLSLFMGWLSWEFYKKSSDASEKTQQAVVKIETAVLSIQSEITEIVRRAVGYWTGSSTEEVNEQNQLLSSKLDELATKIQDISAVKGGSQEGVEALLAEMIRIQKSQVSNLTSSINEAKVKAIFPSIDRGPVAQVEVNPQVTTEDKQSGEIIINVIRPSKIATATAKFPIAFKAIPNVEIELLSSPYDDNKNDLIVTHGVGCEFNFNVHLIGKNGFLQVGAYVIKFDARKKEIDAE